MNEPYRWIEDHEWPVLTRHGLFHPDRSICGIDGETEESCRRVRDLLWGPEGTQAAHERRKESDAAQKRTGTGEVNAGADS